jgi:uncharacterized membrane protein YeaQ/YmgE (transglycosylase-associated protein family)
MMGILLWIILGLAVGLVARWVMPGPSAGGFVVAIPLGVAGALRGGFVGASLTGTLAGLDIRGLLLAMIGSLVVLFSYRSYAQRATA